MDLLIPADLANAERVLAALAELPWGIARQQDAATVVAKPFTIIGDDPRVDLLTIAAKVRSDAAWPRRIVRRIEGAAFPT